MLIQFKRRKSLLVVAALFGIALSGCNDSNPRTPEIEPGPEPTPVTVSYEVTVTNLTQAQPLSPVAVMLHADGHAWTVGESASVEFEQLAEGGDATALLALPMVMASASGEAPVGPGMQDTISVTIEDTTDAKLTVATMLVNTNDAFTGLDAYDLSQLAVGESYMTYAHTYDAGTEANNEAAGTIPGPADRGTGFDETRDDVNFVAGHRGIVSSDDGLSSSVLSSLHKFDNPSVRIKVVRIE